MSLEPASDAIARENAVAPPFACSYTNGGFHAAWVHVGGEPDIATTPQVKRTLDAVRPRPAVLDVRELAFIDSCGINAIVGAGGRSAGRPPAGSRGGPSGSPFREWGSRRNTNFSRYRHDPVDRGARKGSTSWRP
jgi:hypothetical protein